MKHALRTLILCLAMTVSAPYAQAQTAAPDTQAEKPASQTAYDFTFFDLDGNELPLSAYRGKVVLIVNTASGCGFAGQFRELQKLSEVYGAQGLVVIGVPSNDFGGQEPLEGDALRKAAEVDYGATFTLTQKTPVSGTAAHPFYVWAAGQNVGGLLSRVPRWNFHKYVIGRDGTLRLSVPATTAPQDAGFTARIEALLSEKTD